MHLIAISLIAVSILALLTGFSVLFGATKSARGQALTFFMTTIGVFGWSLSMATIMTLSEEASSVAPLVIYGVYIFTLVMDLFIVVYVGWKVKGSWLVNAIAILGTLFFSAALIYNPHFLYSEIVLSPTGNSLKINFDWYYISYAIFTLLEGLMVAIMAFYRIRHSNARIRHGWTIFLASLMIVWTAALIFDLLLPIWRYDLIWIGPVALSIDFVVHYYVILRYRLIDLSSSWIRVMSHIIIMSLAAIVYLAAFFIIFTALFHVSNPAPSIIILTSIMIIVVLLLFPVLNEISGYVRSLSSIRDIDIIYVVKKLHAISKEYINYHELADFLADHMHFQYVGLIIGEKLYGTQPIKLTSADIVKIAKAHSNEKSNWLTLNPELEKITKSAGIEAVANLKTSDGEIVGRILIGRPLGNINFSNRDISSIETALFLVATAINSERGPRA